MTAAVGSSSEAEALYLTLESSASLGHLHLVHPRLHRLDICLDGDRWRSGTIVHASRIRCCYRTLCHHARTSHLIIYMCLSSRLCCHNHKELTQLASKSRPANTSWLASVSPTSFPLHALISVRPMARESFSKHITVKYILRDRSRRSDLPRNLYYHVDFLPLDVLTLFHSAA